ncbi:hypothetical protein IPP24_04045 [Candidatus Saccharibacteria bacterium]|nr:MAG: hypothetical protein IPP24_04045 [Candidatus Saccharibacteria bacterium]
MNTSRRVVGRYAALGLVLGLVVLGVFWVLFQPLRGASTQKPPLGSATVTQTVAPTSETTIPVTSSTAPVSTSPTTVTATTSQTTVAPTTSAAVRTTSTAPVVSRVFNRYTINFPAGTTMVGSQTGKWGEVRTTYHTPAGEQLMTIAFLARFQVAGLQRGADGQVPECHRGPADPHQLGWVLQGWLHRLGPLQVRPGTVGDVHHLLGGGERGGGAVQGGQAGPLAGQGHREGRLEGVTSFPGRASSLPSTHPSSVHSDEGSSRMMGYIKSL